MRSSAWAIRALSREFASEHSERLWKQLVMAPAADDQENTSYSETLVVLGLAAAAALAVKVPALSVFRSTLMTTCPRFYVGTPACSSSRCLPSTSCGSDRLNFVSALWLALPFAARVFANIYPAQTRGAAGS